MVFPTKVVAIFRPWVFGVSIDTRNFTTQHRPAITTGGTLGGMSQTEDLMLFGIHSTKYEEFLFCGFK